MFHYVKSCFGRYSGNIRTSVLVSPSLRILLFQRELVPGSAALCQVLLCSSQRYFNFISLFLSSASWKTRIKTQWVRTVRRIQRPPVHSAESVQLLMRWSCSQASNAEHLMCFSFQETAKWSSTPSVATGAVINSSGTSVCLRRKPKREVFPFFNSRTQTHFTHG